LGVLPLVTSLLNLGLESCAAEQILLYHMDGKTIPLSNISGYLPAPQHATFFTQLAMKGNYPQYAKLMSQSSGALKGLGQTKSDQIRTAGDTLFHLGVFKEYSNWSYPNPTDIALKLIGLFQTGIIDTAINVTYTKLQTYNEVSKLNMKYYVNNVVYNTVYFDKPLCSSRFGNVTFVIN
jgi:hypothetical protein